MTGIECPECGTGKCQTFDTGDAVCENNHNFDVGDAALSGHTNTTPGDDDLPTFGAWEMEEQLAAGDLEIYRDEAGDYWLAVADDHDERTCTPDMEQFTNLAEQADDNA